jgi:hypothetical protein
LTFYLSAAWTLWRLARADAVVVAKTNLPMLSAIAAPIAPARRAKLINWLRTCFPRWRRRSPSSRTCAAIRLPEF